MGEDRPLCDGVRVEMNYGFGFWVWGLGRNFIVLTAQ